MEIIEIEYFCALLLSAKEFLLSVISSAVFGRETKIQLQEIFCFLKIYFFEVIADISILPIAFESTLLITVDPINAYQSHEFT